MNKKNFLYTKNYNKLNMTNPLSEYPFPQFKRESYFSLNGVWKYKISKNCKDLSNINNDIIVPFPIESVASSVNKKIMDDEYIIYKKNFTLPIDFIKENTFINFLGIDQQFTLILNNHHFDTIFPLCLPSKINVSDYIKQNNELILIVKDNLDFRLPKGKQSSNPKGIFYTAFSGVYYPIYIESMNNNYINNITINTTMDSLSLIIDSTSNEFDIIIKECNNIIYNKKEKSKNINIKFENPIYWSPDNPFLYDLIIKTKSDSITSYFGLRDFKFYNNTFYLNNNPIFLCGLLNQGYYPEGIITPIDYSVIEEDIKLIKELGFNTIREHIKIDIPYFYYLCDKYGIIVIQDFMNFGKYNFIKDTALPNIGFKNKNDKNMNKDNQLRSNFFNCSELLISYLNNHPSIIGYTIFNEGWGQFDSDNVYKHFKTKYPNLIFDSTSGWYKQKQSDLISEHWYFNNLNKLSKQKEKIFLSEFGALCYKVKTNCFSQKKVFGYKYYKNSFELEKHYNSLFQNKIIPYKDNLNGIIYTQFSDIEEEDNGLVTYDRKVLKINKKIIQEINKKLVN